LDKPHTKAELDEALNTLRDESLVEMTAESEELKNPVRE
jgi:hypothetical protein